jgi:hypothetical protein
MSAAPTAPPRSSNPADNSSNWVRVIPSGGPPAHAGMHGPPRPTHNDAACRVMPDRTCGDFVDRRMGAGYAEHGPPVGNSSSSYTHEDVEVAGVHDSTRDDPVCDTADRNRLRLVGSRV